MHEPLTKLGLVRRATYFPGTRRLRVVTAAGRVYVAADVTRVRVEAARGDALKIQRLVDGLAGWRLVSHARRRVASTMRSRARRRRR